MRISETLELSIPDDMDVNKLERYLAREIKRFGKQVFGRVLQEIETKKLEEARQEAVFGRAEKVRNDGKQREIVVLEVDGTMLHSQEKGEMTLRLS